jgi:hypothetical protein
MALSPLEAIRAKLKEQTTRGQSGGTSGYDTAVYPVWNLKEGIDSLIRFLPDADRDNTFFWVERSMINIPFPGVKGQTDNREVIVKVPCMDMYNEPDPILNEIRPWWNDPDLKATASIYWKKRSYFFQGFVVEDGLKEENPPENPIRRFMITPQIFQLIKSSLLDPELESMPTETVNGIDFRISKTQKGKYADYSTSKWSRRSRPLSEYELAAIEKYGLFNLRDFLPKKPTLEEQALIKEMFEASVNGEAYDLDRWGQYYKPFGVGDSEDGASAPASTSTRSTIRPPVSAVPTPAPTASDDEDMPWEDQPSVSEPTTSSATKAEDILAIIRNRKTG